MGYRQRRQCDQGIGVITDADRTELLEIYKLHAELADRVSQRREGANRLYVSVLAGMVTFLAVSIRFGVGDLPADVMLRSAGVFGALLSFSWFVVLRSYRQLNSGKFQALRDLETKLAYPFFTTEWDLLRNRYWKLTVVETGLPCIFCALFVALTALSFTVSENSTFTCVSGG